MVTFRTRKEADTFAKKRIAGFKSVINKAHKDAYYGSSAKLTKQRKEFLRKAIKTVKVKKIQLKHWEKPIYRVVGM